MGNDKNSSNIIALYDHGEQSKQAGEDANDTTRFIVDMLDSLMLIAAKNDQSVLVYLLAMARIEAVEPSPPKDNQPQKT